MDVVVGLDGLALGIDSVVGGCKGNLLLRERDIILDGSGRRIRKASDLLNCVLEPSFHDINNWDRHEKPYLIAVN